MRYEPLRFQLGVLGDGMPGDIGYPIPAGTGYWNACRVQPFSHGQQQRATSDRKLSDRRVDHVRFPGCVAVCGCVGVGVCGCGVWGGRCGAARLNSVHKFLSFASHRPRSFPPPRVLRPCHHGSSSMAASRAAKNTCTRGGRGGGGESTKLSEE